MNTLKIFTCLGRSTGVMAAVLALIGMPGPTGMNQTLVGRKTVDDDGTLPMGPL